MIHIVGRSLDPAVYPFNLQEIYPAMSVEGPPIVDVKLAMHYPTFNLCEHPSYSASVTRLNCLPTDPAVYPHITPYPAVTFEMESQLPTSVYPHFDLCEDLIVSPLSFASDFSLDPAVSKSSSERLGWSPSSPNEYFLIDCCSGNNKVATEVNRSGKGGYPHFDLCEFSRSVYCSNGSKQPGQIHRFQKARHLGDLRSHLHPSA